MSSHRHEIEAIEALREKDGRDVLDAIRAQRCPFCGRSDWFIIGPIVAERCGYIVGCQSVRCDSSWKIMRDYPADILKMIQHSHPKKSATDRSKYVWCVWRPYSIAGLYATRAMAQRVLVMLEKRIAAKYTVSKMKVRQHNAELSEPPTKKL